MFLHILLKKRDICAKILRTDSNVRSYVKAKEIGEDVRHSRNSEEHGNVLQQVQLRVPYTATCKKYPNRIPDQVATQKTPCKEFEPKTKEK